MTAAEPVRRAFEIEESSNRYIIHPLANRLVIIFDRLHLTPNIVSFMGMACGILAGIAYFGYRDTAHAVAGFLLMFGWHVLDGADGQLARLQNSQSEFGKIIDGVCDYSTFISVYIGLSLAMIPLYGHSIWFLTVSAGVVHAMQAAAYEVQRQEYNSWGLQRRSALLPRLDEVIRSGPGISLPARLLSRLYWLYVWMQYRVSGSTDLIRARVERALAQFPEQAPAIRACYREIFAPSVRRWSILSSNHRTVAIFVAALAKLPVAYFLLEIVVLNGILLLYSQRQHRLYRQLDQELSTLLTA